MTEIPAHVVAGWWRTLAEHQRIDGMCPRCRVPYRCRPWADAFGELVAHGFIPEPPLQTTGGPSAGEPKEQAWASRGRSRPGVTTPAPTASR